ncbi:hypothetical protein EMIT0111MI5_340018 [Burkholderia sp. IT-111MI5]
MLEVRAGVELTYTALQAVMPLNISITYNI